MNRRELRQMIREEVRTEILRTLPELIGEALNKVISNQVRTEGGQKRRKQVVKEGKKATPATPFDRSQLTALLGYAEMETPRPKSVPVPTVAGVPVNGGLAAMEAAAGMAHFRDYDAPLSENRESEVEEGGYEPQHSALPGGVDGGADVPMDIVAALGKRAKRTLDEAEYRTNWRPGMKKNG